MFSEFVFVSGMCIKCWYCRSDFDPKCQDPFDNTTVPIKDCAEEKQLTHLPGVKATMCRKIRQKGRKNTGGGVDYLFIFFR